MAWAAVALTAVACGSLSKPPDASVARSSRVWGRRAFDFRAPSGAIVSSETVRGRPTVLLFVTTHDIRSQVALRQLSLVVETFRPRANAAAVVVEAPHFAPLLSTFEQTLELRFPAVMADYGTLSGNGPFGPLADVPTAIILDRYGNEQGRLGASDISEQTLRARLRQAAAAATGNSSP